MRDALNMLGLRKIGEGKYREVYEDGEKCFKVLKTDLEKQHSQGTKIHYPLRMYTFLKFGIWDFNTHELRIYREMSRVVPEEHMRVIAPLEKVEKIEAASVLVGTLIKDQDGDISPSLAQYGKIPQNHDFWDTLNMAHFTFEEYGFPHFGLNEYNVVVQTTAAGIRPCIIDLKRVGVQTLPFQPWLLFREMRLNKLVRMHVRIEEEYSGAATIRK